MISETELAAEIEIDEAKPKKREPIKRDTKPKPVTEQDERLVWVRCVVENQPWANNMPLSFWEDYEITYYEALLLEERRFAVILKSPENLGV
jgi:hypothetical protein